MEYIEGKLLISDEIYNKLLTKISEGRWGVGEKIPSEKQLCEMFGASRVSVRAALHKLQANDLIVTRQGVGSIVKVPGNGLRTYTYEKSDISVEVFQQFTEFRTALEFKALDLLVANYSEDQIAPVRAAMRALEESKDKGDAEVDRCDYLFHMAIINSCGNEFIKAAMDVYKDFFLHYVEEVHRLAPVPPEALIRDHQEMLRAIESRKPSGMQTILLEDLLIYQKRIFWNK